MWFLIQFWGNHFPLRASLFKLDIVPVVQICIWDFVCKIQIIPWIHKWNKGKMNIKCDQLGELFISTLRSRYLHLSFNDKYCYLHQGNYVTCIMFETRTPSKEHLSCPNVIWIGLDTHIMSHTIYLHWWAPYIKWLHALYRPLKVEVYLQSAILWCR